MRPVTPVGSDINWWRSFILEQSGSLLPRSLPALWLMSQCWHLSSKSLKCPKATRPWRCKLGRWIAGDHSWTARPDRAFWHQLNATRNVNLVLSRKNNSNNRLYIFVEIVCACMSYYCLILSIFQRPWVVVFQDRYRLQISYNAQTDYKSCNKATVVSSIQTSLKEKKNLSKVVSWIKVYRLHTFHKIYLDAPATDSDDFKYFVFHFRPSKINARINTLRFYNPAGMATTLPLTFSCRHEMANIL